MKKLTLLTVTLFLIIQTSSAQKQKTKYILTPGDHLVKAETNMLVGLLIPAIGFTAASSMTGTSKDGGTTIAIISGIVGVACEISAAVHIGKAGRLLNKDKIGITLNKNGIGLRWNLSKS